MDKNTMILGENQYYSLDCYKTKLNNNVLVVGASGAGKTRSIVTPNILQASGSYIISDPKGNLYQKYKDYLEGQGYVVKKLDFTNPLDSARYNFFRYIKDTQDIVKIAHMLIYPTKQCSRHLDPFWDEASQLLVQSLMAYLIECRPREEQNLHMILKLLAKCNVSEQGPEIDNSLDKMMNELLIRDENSYAATTYFKFRVAAARTLKSILITINARLGLYDIPEIAYMTSEDEINIRAIGTEKTALFVVVSDTDRSVDNLVNIFFTQAMNELCSVADVMYPHTGLPIPVRFIMDDFATNCKIDEFPRMISSIRSRRISTMVMLQSEAQLEEGYDRDGKTIIANCDTYVYLGGNDLETAKSIAQRCDLPVKNILNMPIETNWIFRRGQAPINGRNFNLDKFLQEKGLVSPDSVEIIEK